MNKSAITRKTVKPGDAPPRGDTDWARVEKMTEDEVLAAALSDPDLYTRDPDGFAKLSERVARNRADIEAAEVRWLEVAEMAEQLGA